MKYRIRYFVLFFFGIMGLAACKKESIEIPKTGIYKGEFRGYYYDYEYNKVEMDTIAYYYVREVSDNQIIIAGDTIVKNKLDIEGQLRAYQDYIKNGWRYRFKLASISGKLVELENEHLMQGGVSCVLWLDYKEFEGQGVEFQEHIITGTFNIYPIDSFILE